MRSVLRSVIKSVDPSGRVVVDKEVLSNNFQLVYSVDLVWVSPEKDVWDVIRGFWVQYQDVPTLNDVRSELERSGKSDVRVVVDDVERKDFMETASLKAHIDSLLVDRKKKLFLQAAKEAILITAQGQRIGKTEYKGVGDGVRYLMSKVVPLLEEAGGRKVGGEPRKDGLEMRETYRVTKANPGAAVGILTGIDAVDNVTHGMKPGELVVMAAFQSEGKSTHMANMVYNAVFRQGFNAVIFSREMTYKKMREMFYVLHSHHPKWAGVGEPLETDWIKTGTLSLEAEKFYLDKVIPDFQENSEYGRLYIEPPTQHLSVTDIRVRSEFLNTQSMIDLVCVDYLGLCTPEPGTNYDDYKSRLNQMYVDFKQLALSFDGGRGAPVLTGHQVNRSGKEKAEQNAGVYRTQALSDANQCERAADIILANYLDQDLRAMSEGKITMLKNRDGKVADPFNVVMRLESGYVGNLVDSNLSSEELMDLNFLS